VEAFGKGHHSYGVITGPVFSRRSQGGGSSL
jgi:hypothetical protein